MWLKIVGLAALLVAVNGRVKIPEDLQEVMDVLHMLCIKEAGITEDQHKSYQIADKDPKIMCYMKCIMSEAKWMSPDGEIRYDFIEKTAHPQLQKLLMADVNKCRVIDDGADLCEKAYNFNKCMHDADSEVATKLNNMVKLRFLGLKLVKFD